MSWDVRSRRSTLLHYRGLIPRRVGSSSTSPKRTYQELTGCRWRGVACIVQLYSSAIKPSENLRIFRLEREVEMNARPSWDTFSLSLILIGCFVCWPSWARGQQIGAGPLAQPPTADIRWGSPRPGHLAKHKAHNLLATKVPLGFVSK